MYVILLKEEKVRPSLGWQKTAAGRGNQVSQVMTLVLVQTGGDTQLVGPSPDTCLSEGLFC